MDKLKQWQNQIVGLVALAILVAGFVAAPEERLDKVGHALVAFGSTTAGQAIYAAAGALLVAAFRWALARIPTAAPTESRPQRLQSLAFWFAVGCAIGATAQGCGAQLSESARVALAVRTQICLVQERAIVDRTGTTAEQDAADLAASRAQCDADRAAIVEGN